MANYYVIALVGLFLSSTFCRAFTIIAIKKERTLKAFFLTLVFGSFCFLYLRSAVLLSTAWRDTGLTILLVSMALGNVFEWREFLVKMNEKDKVFHDTTKPETHTLKAIAQADVPVSLEATAKDVSVSLEATAQTTKDVNAA